mmetsp:Transcript_9555/g.14657  ORF Transcript_9555/g.14657 Transcript_9555/m.14657 type:complete len:231 (+) Transcript_9555:347-1039(+)
MGDNGADYSSKITRCKGNSELCGLIIRALGCSENIGIKGFNNLLKEIEFSHSVRNLARPQRSHRTEGKFILYSLCPHFSKSWAKFNGESSWRRCLNLDLDHFHRAECHISKKLSRGGTSKINESSVLVSVLFTSQIAVIVLEKLVKPKLEQTLSRITKKGGHPSLPNCHATLFSNDSFHRRDQTFVLNRVNLHIALGNIQRSDGCVSKSTGKDTAQHALHVVPSCVRHFM